MGTTDKESGNMNVESETLNETQLETISEFTNKADTTVKTIVYNITHRRNNLRDSKPNTNGFDSYVWRRCLSHGEHIDGVGEITTQSRTYLQEFLDENGIEASVNPLTDENGEAILRFIERNIIPSVINEIESLEKSPSERLKDL